MTFQPKLKTINEIDLIEGINVHMDNSNSELQIKKIVDAKIKSIGLINYLGQTVKSWNKNLENRTLNLPLKNNNSGMFIVQINTEYGEIIKQIIITKYSSCLNYIFSLTRSSTPLPSLLSTY